MPTITIVAPSGERLTLEVPEGKSIMQAAVGAGIDGIVAECGGEMVCATCHVYVLSDHLAEELPPLSELESEMLDYTVAERRENSRLSCQLVLSTGHNGLVIGLPDAQI